MSQEKKSANIGSTLAAMIAALLGTLSLILKNSWLGIAALMAGGSAYFYSKREKFSQAALKQPVQPSEPTVTQGSGGSLSLGNAETSKAFVAEQAIALTDAAAEEESRPAAFSLLNGQWLPAGSSFVFINAANKSPATSSAPACPEEKIEVANGMVYVGTGLKTPQGDIEPCLIDTSLPVAPEGSYTVESLGNWPNYTTTSPNARRAYLNWLAGGRQDPKAQIGYVFLFLYGLERRAIVDSATDPLAKEDWPTTAFEIRRLLSIYGEKSSAFKSYAGELLNWISLAEHATKFGEQMPRPVHPKYLRQPALTSDVQQDVAPFNAELRASSTDLSTVISVALPEQPFATVHSVSTQSHLASQRLSTAPAFRCESAATQAHIKAPSIEAAGMASSLDANSSVPFTAAIEMVVPDEERWISAGQPYTFDLSEHTHETTAGPQRCHHQRIEVSGGMFYVSPDLEMVCTKGDPCPIDTQPHAVQNRTLPYHWPNISQLSESARCAYLNWLGAGRKDLQSDILYVYCFFFGLERRVLIDGAQNLVAKAELQLIAHEICRLISIYGERSSSFRTQAGELLNWILLVDQPAQLYKQPIPSVPQAVNLFPYIRLALGQAAKDQQPVPAHIALAWAKQVLGDSIGTVAPSCKALFEQHFLQKYADFFDQGLVLPGSPTKLKFVYRPAAWQGLPGRRALELTLGDIPDVCMLTSPLKKLQIAVDSAIQDLEPYSQFVNKNLDAAHSLEGLLLLPPSLWPEEARTALQTLKSGMARGVLAVPYEDLLSALRTTRKSNIQETQRVFNGHARP